MRRPTPLPDGLPRAFSTAQAAAAGVGRGRLRGPDLERPFHGVRTSRLDPTSEDPASGISRSGTPRSGTPPSGTREADAARRARSYLTIASPSATFCGPTAAVLLGIPLPPGLLAANRRVHVAVPYPQRAPKGRGVAGRSLALDPDEVTRVDGLPVTSPSRTWCDLASLLGLDDLVAAGDRVLRIGDPLATPETLETAVLRYGSRRGSRRLREAHPLLDGRAESPQESRVRVVLQLAGIVGLVPNLEVRTSAGRRHRLDLAIPSHRIAIEYQGDYHRDPRQFRADLVRRAELEADGWRVILIGADHLRDPDRLAVMVRSHLRSSAPTRPESTSTRGLSVRMGRVGGG